MTAVIILTSWWRF